MSDNSKIEWTDATWNIITGCSVVSPGCTNCYAMKLAGTRLRNHQSRAGLTNDSRGGPVWNGEVRFNEQWLTQPLLWAKPRHIFVCAHGDLFHESVPFEWIAKVFAVMACTTRHTYQVLTKRPERMLKWFNSLRDDTLGYQYQNYIRFHDSIGFWPTSVRPAAVWPQWTPNHGNRGGYDCCGPLWPLENVWIGTSAEDQQRADERIPLLLRTPAVKRWISAEPLLGPVTISSIEKLDWVVVGGESGPNARPMHPAWVRSLRDQSLKANVPFFFKQWGGWGPEAIPPVSDSYRWPVEPGEPFGGVWSYRVGKKSAGRMLDELQWDGKPA